MSKSNGFDFPPPPPSSPLHRGGGGGGSTSRERGGSKPPEAWDSSEHFPSLADRARSSTRHVIKNGLASPTHSAHAAFFRAASSSIARVVADKKAKKVSMKNETN